MWISLFFMETPFNLAGGLSAGAVAGIVAAGIVVAVIGAAVIYFFTYRQCRKKVNNTLIIPKILPDYLCVICTKM